MRRVVRVILGAALAAALIALPATAWATFTGSQSATMSVTTGSIAPPTSIVMTPDKCNHGNDRMNLTISWTAASPRAGVTGYQVALSPGSTQSVSAQTTSVTFGAKGGTTYTVTVTSLSSTSWTASSTVTQTPCP